ncbi:MAG: class I SAM-dependent methyltransferase, partial [Pseudomonadota bacterium]
RGILPDWQRLAVPRFETACDWTVATLAAYLRSWSATQRFIRANGIDPVTECYSELAEAFGKGRRRVRWPLVVHVLRRPDSD